MKVRDTARLHEDTVANATKHVKKKPRKKPQRAIDGSTTHTKVDKRVMIAAKTALREGERIKIVSEEEVWLIPR